MGMQKSNDCRDSVVNLLMTADVTLDDHNESVQSNVGLLALLNQFCDCLFVCGDLLIVTLSVVSEAEERVSQSSRESYELLYLTIYLSRMSFPLDHTSVPFDLLFL